MRACYGRQALCNSHTGLDELIADAKLSDAQAIGFRRNVAELAEVCVCARARVCVCVCVCVCVFVCRIP